MIENKDIIERAIRDIPSLSRKDLEKAFIDHLRVSLSKTELIREMEHECCPYCRARISKKAV